MDAGNWRSALEIFVHPEQERFVADHHPPALVILSKCYVRPSGRELLPYLVHDGPDPVGVFALSFGDRDVELLHLAVDRARQGRGYGTAVLERVVQLVSDEHPACREVRLTVNPDNVVAQSLYAATGFVRTGEVRDGELVMVRPLAGTVEP